MNNTELELRQLELLEKIHELLKPKPKLKPESNRRISKGSFLLIVLLKRYIYEYVPFQMKDNYSIELS